MSSPLRARLEASWRMSLFTRQLTQCCVAGVVTVSLVAAEARVPAAVATSLREVLARTADYSAAYGDALASVVADEQFEQELVLRREGTVLERRRLESEIAFVKLADTVDWLAFRSVLRLDGVSLSDASGTRACLPRHTPFRPRPSESDHVESARHNLGPAQRNFNVPTTVLQFILRQHQDRFRFGRPERVRQPDPYGWWSFGSTIEERSFARPKAVPRHRKVSPGLFPATGGLSAPADGESPTVEAEIEAAWRSDATLAMWVPSEMRERYRGPWTTPALEAGRLRRARACDLPNYRRFTSTSASSANMPTPLHLLSSQLSRALTSGLAIAVARRMAVSPFGWHRAAIHAYRQLHPGSSVRPAVAVQEPGFAAVAVLTLALGVGANTAIFSVLRAVVLRDLPYHDADRIAVLWTKNIRQNLPDGSSYLNFRDWKEQSREFQDMAAYFRPEFTRGTLGGGPEPERIHLGEVGPGFFQLLGTAPLLGRTFEAGDFSTAGRAVVISHGLWQQRFAADRARHRQADSARRRHASRSSA